MDLILGIVVIAIVLILIVLIAIHMSRNRGTGKEGHYIGYIEFAPEVGLPNEPLSMMIGKDGSFSANSRMEYPEILPPAVTVGDVESAWLGHYDCASGKFHMMSYRQGAIPDVFMMPISTSPNYVMVMSGSLTFKGCDIETTDVKLFMAPVNWTPPQKLTQAAGITKLSLKKFTPHDVITSV